MISHSLKVIFIHTPRTGGTSIEKALVDENWWNIEPETKHIDWKEARELYASEWDDYLKFSIVRNPWDWLVSLYFSHDQTRSLKQGLDFNDYVRSPVLANHEQDSIIQSDILGDELDFILRFENLQGDFDALCKALDTPKPDLPYFTAMSGREGKNNKHYSAYYDDELHDIVATRHLRDIERFGYTFESKSSAEQPHP